MPEPPVNVNETNLTDLSIYLPQHSSAWFQMRKQFAVTGYTLYNIDGFDLKLHNNILTIITLSLSLPKSSEEVQKAMDHGTAFDNNVLAALCTKILPVHFPLLVHAKIGSAVLNQFKNSHYYTEDGQCKTNGK